MLKIITAVTCGLLPTPLLASQVSTRETPFPIAEAGSIANHASIQEDDVGTGAAEHNYICLTQKSSGKLVCHSREGWEKIARALSTSPS